MLDIIVSTDVTVEPTPTFLGIAAIITAIGGIVSTVWGVLKSHKEGKDKADQELRTRLKECREDSEKLAEELHRIKMDRLDRES